MFKNLYNKVRRWFGMLLGGSKQLKEILNTQISEDMYKRLESWKSIYSGYYPEFHDVSYSTVNGQRQRKRHTLNMGKMVAQELSKLIFTEKVAINISDEELNKNILQVLSYNRFDKVFQNKLEQMFALGGLVLKGVPEEEIDGSYKIKISYVTPDLFVPTSWENEQITEGVFLNITRKDDNTYVLFEFHKWTIESDEISGEPVKKYVVKNELYKKESKIDETLKRVPLTELYPDLEEIVKIEGLTQPLFQYIKPNVANNFDLQSPLGISIYANALDTLFALDVAFDSFIREFKLGKRRILVPSSAVRPVVDPQTGELQRYFDADDEVYQAMNIGDPDKQKIADNTVPIRVDEHVAAINALLNLLAVQTGFSVGTFTFDGVSVKTATEVISENSKTYQTVSSNENIIEEGLIKFIKTLTELGALYDIFDIPEDDYDIDIYWDDSIIGDKYTDSDFYIKLNQNGLVSKKFALRKILNLTDEQAEEMLNEIADEKASRVPDLNDLVNQGLNLGVVE